MNPLSKMQCSPGGQAAALSDADINKHLATLNGWKKVGDPKGGKISKTFSFANHHETVAFVAASAWISHREDHHPDMGVHYNRCVVDYSTHDAGGITLNDMICAAKLDALFDL